MRHMATRHTGVRVLEATRIRRAQITTGRRAALLLSAGLALSACQDGQNFLASLKSPAKSSAQTSTSTKLVERDVEAPDVFQVSDKGLWDGRPSLGGVWVAHAEVTDPERVLIRNEANGKFVIGALFKREVTAPGPGIQVSSDAADALGMLAGAPADLNVTALRREEVPQEAPETVDTIAGTETIEATTLDDPIADAAATLDALDAPDTAPASAMAPKTAGTTSTASSTPAAMSAPKPAPAPAAAKAPSSGLTKPFLQIGIFSIQDNAKRTVDMLGSQGVVAVIKPGTSNGKDFWRVVVGPAASSSERKSLLEKVKKAGFTDAYPVTH